MLRPSLPLVSLCSHYRPLAWSLHAPLFWNVLCLLAYLSCKSQSPGGQPFLNSQISSDLLAPVTECGDFLYSGLWVRLIHAFPLDSSLHSHCCDPPDSKDEWLSSKTGLSPPPDAPPPSASLLPSKAFRCHRSGNTSSLSKSLSPFLPAGPELCLAMSHLPFKTHCMQLSRDLTLLTLSYVSSPNSLTEDRSWLWVFLLPFRSYSLAVSLGGQGAAVFISAGPVTWSPELCISRYDLNSG